MRGVSHPLRSRLCNRFKRAEQKTSARSNSTHTQIMYSAIASGGEADVQSTRVQARDATCMRAAHVYRRVHPRSHTPLGKQCQFHSCQLTQGRRRRVGRRCLPRAGHHRLQGMNSSQLNFELYTFKNSWNQQHYPLEGRNENKMNVAAVVVSTATYAILPQVLLEGGATPLTRVAKSALTQGSWPTAPHGMHMLPCWQNLQPQTVPSAQMRRGRSACGLRVQHGSPASPQGGSVGLRQSPCRSCKPPTQPPTPDTA